ncbi:MAG: folate family ECF transporter S component [Erysipelotrichaceae bacterium]
MVIFLQILSIALVLGFGFVAFKIDKPVFKIKSIVMVAIFATLTVVLSIVSVMVPMFGFPSLRIGFSQLPLMLSGVILGPFFGVLTAVVGDLLGLLLNPTDFPFFGFMLSEVIVAFIPAAVFGLFRKYDDKQSSRLVIYLLTVVAVGVVVFTLSNFSLKFGDQVMQLNLFSRLLILVVLVSFLVAIYFIMTLLQKHLKKSDVFSLNKWIFCVILIEIVVNICLHPLWLQVMYGIPYMGSAVVRIVKGVIMIGINGFVGYFLLRMLARFMRLSVIKGDYIEEITDDEIVVVDKK